MVFETIIPLAIALGAKFFASFLAGMLGTFFLTRSVYLALAGGAAVGFIVLLLL